MSGDEGGKVYTDSGPFAIVPEWLLNADVSSRAVHAYAILGRYADREGHGFPGRKLAAIWMGCSPDTFDRAVAELEGVGALIVTERRRSDGSQTSNDYRVIRADPRRGVGTDAQAPLGVGAEAINESQKERETPRATRATPPPSKPMTRPRNELWDAVTRVCGLSSETLTKSEASKVGKVVREIKDAGGTPEEVERRAAEYRRRWPRMDLTPTALVNHWSKMNPNNSNGDPPTTAEIARAIDAIPVPTEEERESASWREPWARDFLHEKAAAGEEWAIEKLAELAAE